MLKNKSCSSRIYFDTLCQTEQSFSALGFILYITVRVGSFSSLQKEQFPLLTPRYDDAFFCSQMSAICMKNVRKHCVHAWSFLRVWMNCQLFKDAKRSGMQKSLCLDCYNNKVVVYCVLFTGNDTTLGLFIIALGCSNIYVCCIQ